MNEQLKVIISAEIDKLKQNINEAKNEIKSFKDQVKEASKTADEDLKKAGNSIKKGATVAAVGIAAAGTALVALSASTKEYRTEQAKLTTAFEAAGGSAETAKETYNDLYRVLGDGGQATEAAAHLAQLTTNEKDLAEWTNICQGVYATFGDSLPIEGLTEAANETAKVGTVTGGLADALNWAGISEDAFNESLAACNSEAEREKLIRETLNGIYDDAATKYEKNNADVLAQNEAQAKLDATLAQLGATFAPVLLMLTELASKVLGAIAPHLQTFAEKYLPTISSLLGGVASVLGKTIGFLLEHKALLITIATVIGTVAAAITLYNAVTAIKAAMDAMQVTTIWGLVAAHIAQAAAAMAALAPYLLIVAAIAAIIAIIVVCIMYWDEIVAVVKKAVSAIVDFVKGLVDKVTAFFNKVIDFVKNNWQTILLFMLNPFAGAFKLIYDKCEGFRNFINNLLAWVKENWAGLLLFLVNPFLGAFKLIYDNCEGFRNFINNLVKTVGNFFTKMWDGLKEGAKNAWNGVKSVFSTVANFFRDIFTAAWEKVKAVFSTGGKIFTGIKDGIVNAFKNIVNGIIGGINKVVAIPFNAINNILDKLRNLKIGGFQPFTWVHTFNVPQIPKLARGGIVNDATLAMIGEQGTEAVVPLENNTEWLDKIAERLNNKGGNAPIILQVDGKTFAEIAVDSINDLTRLRGSMPLKVW